VLASAGYVAVLFAVANTNQVPPWGGVDRLLGPNPISVALPTHDEPLVVLDIATTVASFGEVRAAAKRGGPIPEGWLVDRYGTPIVEPDRLTEGFLQPIGGHKGYGLALVAGLLAGTLNGARFGADVVDHYADLSTPTDTGQAILALRPEFLDPSEDFAVRVDHHVRELRGSTPASADRPIRVPGDQAVESGRQMSVSGMPFTIDALRDLNRTAAEVSVPPLAEAPGE
jgi:L-2-hydroxycarboxylate dehydrogenase (NAD+)